MKNKMMNPGSFLLKMMFVIAFFGVHAQSFGQEDQEKASREARKYMKEAEEALSENDFASAEAYYRQAIAKDPANAAARYNLGNLYYNKEINHESVERHSQAAEVAPDKPIKHNSFHNQGNAFMKQKKYKEAVEAYKNALRNNPKDDETRYNLALAKKMLEEEKQDGEGEDDQNKDQNKDQNQDQDQEGDEGEKEQNEDGEPQDDQEGGEQENKDQQEGDDKEGEEGDPKDPQNEENQDQKGDKPQEQQQQQPRPGQLSPQQVKNLLEAMGNEEKKVQDKINAEKAKGAKTKSEKDW